jgi:hypothetical protein
MKFQNPQNGYIEETSAPWLWTLLFGLFSAALVPLQRIVRRDAVFSLAEEHARVSV